jgi:branched-chain amino acid transport system substrate-binding protein
MHNHPEDKEGTMADQGWRPSRRQVLRGAAAFGAGVGFIGNWRWARAQAKKPLIIGLTCDATGTFADSGQADRRGMILAIEEQNARGGVLGRPIEARWEDTETDPSVAVRKAQKLIERDKIDFMIGALSSGVAAPLSELAQRYGIIYFNSNSSADTVSGEKCQRVNFVWDANGYMFNQALGPLVAKNLGKRWFLLTHDYVWGKNVTAGTRDIMKKVGAEEAGELMVPQGTRDFSAQLLRIRSAKPEVVFANVAGIEQTALREQANEFGSEKDAHWVFPQQDYPDLFALGAKKAFGYFTTTWHYTLTDPGSQE